MRARGETRLLLAPALALLFVLGVLALPGAPTVPGRAPAPPTSAPAPAGLGPSVRASSAPNSCASALAAWSVLHPGAPAPPAPNASELAGCPLTADESSLAFLSSINGSGGGATVSFALPSAGSAVSSALAGLSLRSWTTGAPCSVDGVVEVSVSLVPPLSPYRSVASLNWTVFVSAFDLVPAGSCDPVCSNDSTLLDYGGTPVCEDAVLALASSTSPSPPLATLPPGGVVSVTLSGGRATAAPLTVWVNDTTDPAASRSLTLGASESRLGLPLVPAFATSSASNPVWGPDGAFSIAATDCPLPTAPSSACTSYNASLWQGLAPVEVRQVGLYDPATQAYDAPYDEVAFVSSSARCTSVVVACLGAGAGSFYPSWSILAGNGSAGWGYGGNYATSVRAFPTAPSSLAPVVTAPIAVATPTLVVNGSSAVVAERLADPSGLTGVNLTVSFCTPTLLSASLGPGPSNTSVDGTWVATLPSSANSGAVPVLVSATTPANGSVGPLVTNATVAGTHPSCPLTPLSPPVLLGARPVAGGYLVNWSSAPTGTASLLLEAVAANGNTTNLRVGPSSPALFDLGVGNVSFNLSAASVDGRNVTSNYSPPIAAAPTLWPLVASAPKLNATVAWLGGDPVGISGSVSGGRGPYDIAIAYGGGLSTSVVAGATGTWSASLAFSTYFGLDEIAVTVRDTEPEQVVLPPSFLLVAATPLAPHPVAVGGDATVSVSWSQPPSPSAPVTSYRLAYSSVASLAPLLLATASNATLVGVTVWNTTGTYFSLPVANGGVLYAQVVALDRYGLGLLPSGAPTPLVARPAPFLLSPIAAGPGGPAPFRDNFSATATLGSNDSVVTAYYSFPDGSLSGATPVFVNGTFYLNTSFEFLSPGSYVVVLHAVDVFYETEIATVEVRVTNGAAPALSATVVSGLAYAGSPVDLEATAAGGSGSYRVNWSFGDGGAANGSAVVHTFTRPGTYTVLVTAVDAETGGSASYLLPVLVYALPTVFVSVTPGPNGSLSYDFSASVGGGSGPATVVWSFGDGNVGRGVSVTHDYRAAGTYVVNVSATDPAGRAGATSFNFTANPTAAGGTSTGSGLSPLDLALVAATATLLVVVLVLGARRRPPADSTDLAPPPEEDGEVLLT